MSHTHIHTLTHILMHMYRQTSIERKEEDARFSTEITSSFISHILKTTVIEFIHIELHYRLTSQTRTSAEWSYMLWGKNESELA